jgi:hypothetical protein
MANNRVPVTNRRLDAVAARALGIGPGGALVVRPDGVAARSSARAAGIQDVPEAA